MNDHQSFMAGIIADPENDGRRLAFADWLSEQGKDDRADFIRVQVELAVCAKRAGHRDHYLAESCYCEWCVKAKALRRRERELLGANWQTWLGFHVPKFSHANAFNLFCKTLWPHERCPDPNIEFHRGFVEIITCAFADFLTAHKAGIREATPLRLCNLTGIPDDDTLIEYDFAVLHGDPSIWTSPRFPGLQFTLPLRWRHRDEGGSQQPADWLPPSVTTS